MLIAAGGCTVSGTQHGEEKKIKKNKMDFHYSETKLIIRKFVFYFRFPNNYEKFGRVGSYAVALLLLFELTGRGSRARAVPSGEGS